MDKSRKKVHVYVLTCADGSLYTGWTTDVDARLEAHASGKGGRYTRSRLPVRLRAYWDCASRGEALKCEARFKHLTRPRKLEALEAGTVFGYRVRLPKRKRSTQS